MKIHKIEFSKEERDAVLPQIGSRLDELEILLCQAGADGNTARVMELAKFIENIKSFYYKVMNAY